MGYWTEVSGLDPERELIWGDQMADILDDALWDIVACFAKDMGRLPTKEEVITGILFSLGGPKGDLLGLPEPGDESAVLSDEDMRDLNRAYYPATGGDESPTEKMLAARKEVQRVMKGLRKPYRWDGTLPEVADNGEDGEKVYTYSLAAGLQERTERYVSAGEAATKVVEYLDDRAVAYDRNRPDVIDGGNEDLPAELSESTLRALVRGYVVLARNES